MDDVKQLPKDLNIDNDTLVICTSDNGPSLESYRTEPLEANFFASYGPFDGTKRDCLEGGILGTKNEYLKAIHRTDIL